MSDFKTIEGFREAYNKLRELWGNRTTPLPKIEAAFSSLFFNAIKMECDTATYKKSVEPVLFAAQDEWARRLPFFVMNQAPKKVIKTVTKWPGGKHYYVSFKGVDIDVVEKFSMLSAAEGFARKQQQKLIRQGYEIE